VLASSWLTYFEIKKGAGSEPAGAICVCVSKPEKKAWIIGLTTSGALKKLAGVLRD
jgi:hypothetical protein